MNFSPTLPQGPPQILNLLLALIFVVGFYFLVVRTTTWAADDATSRGYPGCLLGILLFFTWPFGTLIWLIVRKKIPPHDPSSSPTRPSKKRKLRDLDR